MPPSYPAEPPKATFKTKIFHPNIDDRSGDVCVGTLKRDWTPTTTLKDVLVTIRCLLVYPNPTSSLNEEAGKLLLMDYDEYARHAKLMTSIHAVVPEHLQELADEAKLRGEDQDSAPKSESKKNPKPQAEDPKAPAEKRKIKQAVKPSPRTTVPRRHEDTKPPAVKDDSDSEGGESGKENADTIPHSTRPRSPLGKRRSPSLETRPPTTQQPTEDEEPEESGRKSPKLKEGQTANTQQRKPVVTSFLKDTKAKKTAKPPAKKLGLKRF